MLKNNVVLIIIFGLILNFSYSQNDSCWKVLLLHKNKKLKIKDDMINFSKSGFYLYRNCTYRIKLQNNLIIYGRVVDIKPDTIYFTNFFNENVAKKYNLKLDTIPVYYKDIKKIYLIGDRSLGLYETYSLKKFNFIFFKDTGDCSLKSIWIRIFSKDTTKYELVPYLTLQGVNLLYERNGDTYYFMGVEEIKSDSTDKEKSNSEKDTVYIVRNFVWFTPSKVNEINGLSIGLQPVNTKNTDKGVDSLIIRGINISLGPYLMVIPYIVIGDINNIFQINRFLDTNYFKNFNMNWETKIYGMNLSLVLTSGFENIYGIEIVGLNITGFYSVSGEIKGVSISGWGNEYYLLKGVSIAGFRNKGVIVRGLQIGLFNKVDDLRGIQIGLWNKNGKRSLPFINWQFKK